MMYVSIKSHFRSIQSNCNDEKVGVIDIIGYIIRTF